MSDFEPDDRLSVLLDELGQEDPPSTLVRGVMSRITPLQQRKAAPVLQFTKGQPMTRKIIWGVAAAAAVALVVFSMKGFPPTGAGTEGTIGAAKRYQAPQLSEKDVTLGDTSAQAFMQSDTFAKLLKDPAAVKLLSDARFVAQLKSADIRWAIANHDLAAAFVRADVARELQNRDVIAALQNPNIVAAVQKADLNHGVSEAAIQALGVNAEVAAALRSEVFVLAVRQDQVLAAIHNEVFSAALVDTRLGAALKSEVFQQALASSGFFAALQSDRFAAALASSVRAE
jgi:hypothetical protein